MPLMTLEEFRKANIVRSSTTALFGALSIKSSRVAFTYVSSDNSIYFAVASGTPFPPVFKLFGAGMTNVAVFVNYSDLSEGDKGVAMLHRSTISAMKPDLFDLDKHLELFVDGIKKKNAREKTDAAVKSRAQSTISEVRSGMTDALKNVDVFEVEIDIATQMRSLFALPKRQVEVVSDIQSENASVKVGSVYKESGTRNVHRLYMATAFTILRKLQLDPRDGVVALVADRQGRIISWGRKNPNVACWHGETSAIMGLGGVIPPGSRVYSTLKPCSMCSGLIHDSSNGNAKVFWGQDDAGSMAANTVLDRERSGALLDGHKGGGSFARAILLGDKPTGKDVPDNRTTMSKILKDTQGRAPQKEDKRSSINFVASEPARDLIRAAERGLKAKYDKYKGEDEGGNANTRAVVNYLVEFLRDLGLPADSLGS